MLMPDANERFLFPRLHNTANVLFSIAFWIISENLRKNMWEIEVLLLELKISYYLYILALHFHAKYCNKSKASNSMYSNAISMSILHNLPWQLKIRALVDITRILTVLYVITRKIYPQHTAHTTTLLANNKKQLTEHNRSDGCTNCR